MLSWGDLKFIFNSTFVTIPHQQECGVLFAMVRLIFCWTTCYLCKDFLRRQGPILGSCFKLILNCISLCNCVSYYILHRSWSSRARCCKQKLKSDAQNWGKLLRQVKSTGLSKNLKTRRSFQRIIRTAIFSQSFVGIKENLVKTIPTLYWLPLCLPLLVPRLSWKDLVYCS